MRRSAPFLLIGVFVVGMMGVTAALPPHMISLLRERGLGESWVIAIPASIGVIQVIGRLLLFYFEHHFDVHAANRLIPCLIPLGLAALLAGAGHPWAAVLFVLLYGLGNGMQTIVKGTAIAQYVSRDHVGSLNGTLGLPSALSRAVAPLLLGLMWTREAGYSVGLWLAAGRQRGLGARPCGWPSAGRWWTLDRVRRDERFPPIPWQRKGGTRIAFGKPAKALP